MRFQGHNVLAILVAAAAMYAIGFVIYGLVFSQMWQDAVGYDAADYAGLEWRMALSPVMPILIAIGLSLVIKWRNAAGWMGGAVTGFWIALFFLFAARLYNFAYSAESETVLALDGAHLFLNAIVGGAILGAWK